jgi:hypothetical protein
MAATCGGALRRGGLGRDRRFREESQFPRTGLLARLVLREGILGEDHFSPWT